MSFHLLIYYWLSCFLYVARGVHENIHDLLFLYKPKESSLHPLYRKATALLIVFIISDFSLSVVKYNMVKPYPSMEESSVRFTPGAPYVHSMRPFTHEARLPCPAQRERELLNQDLERFWAHQRYEIQNSKGFLSRIKRVMKSDPQVKMVSSETPVILAKACEIFIQEITLRSWRQSLSCSRHTIQSGDVHEALKKSEVYKELFGLVSSQPSPVSHKNEPNHVVHQQMAPLANVNAPVRALNVNVPEKAPNMNVPEKAPIDIDMIQERNLFNLTVDDFIMIDDFELGPHIK